MEVTVTRDIYTYDELDSAAQEVALESLCRAAYEMLDSDLIEEDVNARFTELATGESYWHDAKTISDKFGVRFEWRVGGGQGDGAAIFGALRKESAPKLAWPVGVEGVITKISNFGWTQVSCIIVHDEAGDEYHQYGVDERTMFEVRDMLDDICHALYRAAEKAIDNYTSRDYVVENYRAYQGLQRRFEKDGREAPVQFWVDDDTEVGQ